MQKGAAVYPKKSPGILNVRKSPQVNNANPLLLGLDANNILEKVAYPKKAGTLTGTSQLGKDKYRWYQIRTVLGDLGWVRGDAFSVSADNADKQKDTKFGGASTETANAEIRRFLSELVASDEYVYGSLLVIKSQLEALKATGKLDPAREAQYAELAKRYNERQRKLQTSNLVQVKAGTRAKLQPLADRYAVPIAKGTNTAKVGAVPVALYVAAVVVVAIAAAVTLDQIRRMFGGDLQISKVDASKCDALNQAIKNNPDAQKELKELVDEANQKIDHAKDSGGLFGNIGKYAMPMILVAGGFLLLNNSKRGKK